MATAASLISRSLRLLGVVDAAETPAAEDFQTAVDALNSLASRWLASGLIAAWTVIDNPVQSLATPAPADDAFAYSLAVRLAPEYGRAVTPELAALSQEGIAALWRDRLQASGTGTAGALIRRALRLLRVAGPMPDSVDFTGAIEALNALVTRLEANGMALGWSNVSDVSDPLPLPPEAEQAISANLALALAPEYGADLHPSVLAMADGGLTALRRDVKVASPMTWDRGGCAYNTRTDGYDC